MKFYYENNAGDYGTFSEKDLIKAIYTAWNIEATLYLINSDVKKLNIKKDFFKQVKMIFSPWDGNEFNSQLLEDYGYYMVDGDEYREIREIKTDKIVKYDYAEVKQLV